MEQRLLSRERPSTMKYPRLHFGAGLSAYSCPSYLLVKERKRIPLIIVIRWWCSYVYLSTTPWICIHYLTKHHATASILALGPTQPHSQRTSGALSLEVKRPGREADHSSPSSAEVKNTWRYTSITEYAFVTWCSVKKKHNFTFLPRH
jgi:hypothetical protein